MTDTQETPVVEEKDDLDSLLAEFDKGVSAVDTSNESTSSENQPEWRHLEQSVEDLQHQSYRRGIDDSVSKMKSHGGISHVGNTAIEGYMEQRARMDPRITQAFMQREKNPVAWEKVLGSLAQDYSKEIRQPDAQVTEDQKAMRAAVESQPDTAEPEFKSVRDLNNMNDSEFALYKESLM